MDVASKNVYFIDCRLDDFSSDTIYGEYRYSNASESGFGECKVEGQIYFLPQGFTGGLSAIDKTERSRDFGIIYEKKSLEFLDHQYSQLFWKGLDAQTH